MRYLLGVGSFSSEKLSSFDGKQYRVLFYKSSDPEIESLFLEKGSIYVICSLIV